MIDLRPEPPDSHASRALHAEYMALIRERLGPGFAPTEAIFATDDAFTGPGAGWYVGYEGDRAVCCGGLRPLAPGIAELKRMFVTRAARGRGVGRALLAALEATARESGYTRARLLTTEVLVEARALYSSCGYVVVETRRDDDRTDLWLERTLRSSAGPP